MTAIPQDQHHKNKPLTEFNLVVRMLKNNQTSFISHCDWYIEGGQYKVMQLRTTYSDPSPQEKEPGYTASNSVTSS